MTTKTPTSSGLIGAQWREVAVADHVVGFTLLRSTRRTIGFQISDAGLRVTAPRWVPLAEIDDAVRGKAKWILTRQQAWRERCERIEQQRTQWTDHGQLPYLGQAISLRLGAPANRFEGELWIPRAGDTLWLAVAKDADTGAVRAAALNWLQLRAGELVSQRLQWFLERNDLRINRWRLSSARTRWGSCTSRGNIMLNWRLIHFPPDIIDYVIAHELAHLRQMNHSPAFWAEVEKLMPDYRHARDVLRRHDPASLPSF